MSSCTPRTGSVCLPSKATLLILVWVGFIGAIFSSVLSASATSSLTFSNDPHFIKLDGIDIHSVLFLWMVVTPYALISLVLMLYPLSGFIADVYCGRFKAVVIGLYILCFMSVLVIVDSVIVLVGFRHHHHLPNGLVIAFIVFAISGFVLFTLGFGIVQANYIQLGLDQLMEVPTRFLGIFIHWVVWCDSLGASIVYVLFSMYWCSYNDGTIHRHMTITVCSLGPVYFIFLVILLIFNGCYSHRWFYTESGHNNPYKMVFKVLNFARKHKCPVHRSALTYYDGREPSRLDFAKEWYGGPFKSEVVEDVKTFIRVLVVLLALGPVLILEVPSSYFMIPMFVTHTSDRGDMRNVSCTREWMFLRSGNLKYMISVLGFPIYIWLIFGVFPTRIPKILRRLWIGSVLYFLGVTLMLLFDLIGHLTHKTDIGYQGQCMFAVDNNSIPEPLHMHWLVTIPHNVILGIAPLLLYASAFEFISAQSPQPMKGFLVGMFFAIKGFYQFCGVIVLILFSSNKIWNRSSIRVHPPATNCGFGYFLFTLIVALIGLIMFSVVAKKYKYRQRGEDPYGPHVVEDVYHQYIVQQPVRHCVSPVDERPSNCCKRPTFHLNGRECVTAQAQCITNVLPINPRRHKADYDATDSIPVYVD